MSETNSQAHASAAHPEPRRCPNCDAVVAEDATVCLMCGAALSAAAGEPASESTAGEASEPAPVAAETPPAAVSADGRPRPGRRLPKPAPLSARFLLTLLFVSGLAVISVLILRFQEPATGVALFPTATPIPPPATATPTWTPLASETVPASRTPTVTLTPADTPTPPPPRQHQVGVGETLIGLSLRYRVSPDSIAAANGFAVDTPIQVNQILLVPWPTPTPTLAPVAVEVNGETVVADPAGCTRHQVQAGDSLSGVAAQYDIDFDLFLLANRLTADTILQPGDTLCIPRIIYGGRLPPTPGPTPTATATPPLPGPNLLFPPPDTAVEPPEQPPRLQWVAVKDLAPDQWYMVEVRDADQPDQPPYRGFTRDTAFQVPLAWRPGQAQTHLFLWRVSVVQVTGRRSDGGFLYTYGGQTSREGRFLWLGAPPTPTPPPTATAAPVVTPGGDS